MKRICLPVRSTFFENLGKTVMNTRNRSLRILFQHKLVIWIPRSVHSTISEKVGGFNDDFSCPFAPRFYKTTIWENTYVKKQAAPLNKTQYVSLLLANHESRSAKRQSVQHLIPRSNATKHKGYTKHESRNVDSSPYRDE